MSELMTLNCHKFVKEISLYIEQVQQAPRKVNIKKTMCRPITVKILETKDNVLKLVEGTFLPLFIYFFKAWCRHSS